MLAWPIAAIVRTVALWRVAGRIRIEWNPRLDHWRELIGDSFLVLLANVFITVTYNADNLIVGRHVSQEQTGQYYWAFNLSCQTLQLLAMNLGGVLLPSLNRLKGDPARQAQAFLRASRA